MRNRYLGERADAEDLNRVTTDALPIDTAQALAVALSNLDDAAALSRLAEIDARTAASIRDGGPADRAVAIRTMLRRVLLSGAALPPLRVPLGTGWPSLDELWTRHGLQTVDERPGSAELARVMPWTPDWIGGSSDHPDGVDAHAMRAETVHQDEEIDADPFWRISTGFDTYRSRVHRDVVRGIRRSPSDSTILVMLPTGAGKSLIATLPALERCNVGTTTIVIVPTTSLALDQEEAYADHLRRLNRHDHGGPYAFHAGLSPGERSEMHRRVESGQQGVLFISPEGAIGAMRQSISIAAASGTVSRLVVDEAHEVAGWGATFRPAFQLLAAARREWLAHARSSKRGPFRTLLMTATATGHDLDVLEQLFADEGQEILCCGSVELRPELSYLSAKCGSSAEQVQRLVETLDNMPRPAFVYVSEPAHAARLLNELQLRGYSRVAKVTGEDGSEHRRKVARGLKSSNGEPPRFDIVVANTAFGLGINISDVRLVLHACVPETVDRYFQEVGRAGRDGRHAQGIALWTEHDEHAARRLVSSKMLGVVKAQQRWSAMFAAGKRIDGHRVRVWTGAVPEYAKDAVAGTYDIFHNKALLAAMHQVGFLALHGIDEGVQDEEQEDRGDGHYVVDVLNMGLGISGSWNSYEDYRVLLKEDADTRLKTSLRVLRTGAVCEQLSRHYTLDGRWRAARRCAGCCSCGIGPGHSKDEPSAPLPQLADHGHYVGPGFARISGKERLTIAVAPPSQTWEWSTARTLNVIARRMGVGRLVASPRLIEALKSDLDLEETIENLVLDGRCPAIDSITDVISSIEAPTWSATALMVSPMEPPAVIAMASLALNEPWRLGSNVIAILPATAPDPSSPTFDILDRRPNRLSTTELQEILIDTAEAPRCQT